MAGAAVRLQRWSARRDLKALWRNSGRLRRRGITVPRADAVAPAERPPFRRPSPSSAEVQGIAKARGQDPYAAQLVMGDRDVPGRTSADRGRRVAVAGNAPRVESPSEFRNDGSMTQPAMICSLGDKRALDDQSCPPRNTLGSWSHPARRQSNSRPTLGSRQRDQSIRMPTETRLGTSDGDRPKAAAVVGWMIAMPTASS